MLETPKVEKYRRKVTPVERAFRRAPYAIVTMVARIKGNVSEKMLKDAVSKVQQRHALLRVRIEEDADHVPWFTSEGVKEIPVETVARKSSDHWIEIYHEACKTPFEFNERPAIRFILMQSPTVSELIILCHHIICDGMSLAYLARDLMVHLGDPDREIEVLPDPVTINKDTVPEKVSSLNAVYRFLVKRLNKKWDKQKIFFDQEDYKNINDAYWKKFKHRMLSIELTEEQTSVLVDRCRKEGVTVNSAIVTAFNGAHYIIQGDESHLANTGVAGSVRNRLTRPAGEAMGFYAGLIVSKYKYSRKLTFWDNTRNFHKRIKPMYNNKNLFLGAVLNLSIDPTFKEAVTFKMMSGFVSAGSTKYDKLSAFSKRNDRTVSFIKRRKMDNLDKTVMGTVLTNLTRMEFSRKYGPLELDCLIFNPGSSAPLAMVSVVVGAVTTSGKLSMVMEYAEKTGDKETMKKIKEKMIELLLGE
ncbi:MAG: condensation domain-containing protein [Candidatus Odinarchaeota archaeon]